MRVRPVAGTYHRFMAGGEDYLTLRELAERQGWTIKTARTMQYRANRNRAAGTPLPGDLPEPDRRFGRTPVWKRATIDAWEARRPGQGVGGGQPAHS